MKGGHGRVALFGLLGVSGIAAFWMLGQGSGASSPMASTDVPSSQPSLPEIELVVPSLPALKAEQLANGLLVYIYPIHEVPLLSVRLVIPAGSAYDIPSRAGLAALTARLVASGGPDEQASPGARAEAMGARLQIHSYVDEVVLSLDGLSRDLGAFLEMLADIIQKPRFTPKNLERLRDALFAETERALSYPEGLARDAARAALFDKTPYSIPPLGTPRSVKNLSLQDITEFFQARYVPDGAALFLVGDVDPDEGLRLARETLSSWSGKATFSPLTLSPPPPGRRVLVIDVPESQDVHLCVAAFSLPASHPDLPVLDVLNDPLGGGFSSHILDELRVNRGIAYDAISRIESYRYAGWFSVETVVQRENVRVALDIILKSLADYRAVGPSRPEMEGAKAFLASSAARLFEEPRTLADTLARAFGSGSRLEGVGAYANLVRAVDRERAHHALTRHFPGGKDDVVIVAVGAADVIVPALQGLGALTVLTPGEHYGGFPGGVRP